MVTKQGTASIKSLSGFTLAQKIMVTKQTLFDFFAKSSFTLAQKIMVTKQFNENTMKE